MSTNFEHKLADIIVNLRDTATQATKLANQVEAALLKIYEEEGATPSKETPLPIQQYQGEDSLDDNKSPNVKITRPFAHRV